jgi:hypothetical protein
MHVAFLHPCGLCVSHNKGQCLISGRRCAAWDTLHASMCGGRTLRSLLYLKACARIFATNEYALQLATIAFRS